METANGASRGLDSYHRSQRNNTTSTQSPPASGTSHTSSNHTASHYTGPSSSSSIHASTRHNGQGSTRQYYGQSQSQQQQRQRQQSKQRQPESSSLTTSDESYRDSNELPSAFGRDSLVDNLLLSFDRLGQDLALDPSVNQFFQSPHVDDVVEYVDVEEDDGYEIGGDVYHEEEEDTDGRHTSSSRYSNRKRSGSSSNYNSAHDIPRQARRFGSLEFDRDDDSHRFMNVLDKRGFPINPPRSRRGNTSSRKNEYTMNVYDDTAPTPTVSNRDRVRTPQSASPVIPQSRLDRRRSTKSSKSLRYQNSDAMEDVAGAPPMPVTAEHGPASPAPAPSINLAGKPNVKPGFFRRVFGGGNAGKVSSFQSTFSQESSTPMEVTPRPITPPPPAPTVINAVIVPASESTPSRPPTAIQKKSSGFFRRRKKSVSEVDTPAVPKLPFHAQNKSLESDVPISSPVSLRTAMNPFLASPPGSRNQEEIPNARIVPPGARASSRAGAHDTSVEVPRPNTVTPSQSNKSPNGNAFRRPTIRAVASADLQGTSSVTTSEPVPSLRKKVSELNNTNGTTAGPSKRQAIPQTPPQKIRHDTLENQHPKTTSDFTVSTDQQIQSTTAKSTKDSPPLQSKRSLDAKYPPSSFVAPNLTPASVTEQAKDFLQIGKVDARTSDTSIHAPQLDMVQTIPDASMAPIVAGENKEVETPRVVLDPTGDHEESGDGDPDVTPRPNRITLLRTVTGDATPEEAEWAQKIFDGDENFMEKAKAAAWLGESDEGSRRIRHAYMALFDWTGVNILAAMRTLCERLVLKGETQQVDRIVDAIARRWCTCNPNHGLKNIDVVHTMIYSVLLLNTDLHMADIPNSQKMTRTQFTKNTISTIRRGLSDEEDEAAAANSTPTANNRSQTPYEYDEKDSKEKDSYFGAKDKSKLGEPRQSFDQPRSNRMSFMRGAANVAGFPRFFDDASVEGISPLDGSSIGGEHGGPLINAPFVGSEKQWETALEVILKDFYQSVKTTALPLHGVTSELLLDSSCGNSLSVTTPVRRTASVISRAPSEASFRNDRYGNMMNNARQESTSRFGTKWSGKNKSRQKLYPGSFAGSSRTSFDDRMWSPSASSVWSKYSLDKTTTSMMSVDSMASGFGHNDYMQSIGFANALSNAIIREEAASIFTSNDGESLQPTVLDEDLEDLALHGAPWAKEGLVKHKHHLEATEKKAKNRGWTECFAVIEKGWMRLFLFPSSDKKRAPKSSGLVGGGNWMENAESIGNFMLRQTIASALPPPGYSKTRPNVLALSLPNGAVHLFQAGTAEIIKEWVSTANYWSARLSKEPLVGGVSNVEYGWRNCINYDLTQATPPSTSHAGRPSFQDSIRSSMDHGNALRAKLPGDRAVITDWSPPSQSMMASLLNEGDQLTALITYVKKVEMELEKHNELRAPMNVAFTPKLPNFTKAMNNWERKSSYLLREIIKFRTYIDCLSAASAQREVILIEKEKREEEAFARTVEANASKAEAESAAAAVAAAAVPDTAEASTSSS